jgi:hypothetical protein
VFVEAWVSSDGAFFWQPEKTRAAAKNRNAILNSFFMVFIQDFGYHRPERALFVDCGVI